MILKLKPEFKNKSIYLTATQQRFETLVITQSEMQMLKNLGHNYLFEEEPDTILDESAVPKTKIFNKKLEL